MLMFKNTVRLGIQHIFKAKKAKKNSSLRGYHLGQVGVIIWASLLQHKYGHLGPDDNP